MRKKSANEFAIINEESNVRNARWREIWEQGGEGPKHQRPGSEYAPHQMIRMQCAMCRKDMMIRPRTHPYRMRRKDGTVAWLCGPCSGAKYRGESTSGYLTER